MSKDILGNKQTIVLHSFLIKKEKYDLVTTLHRQKKGFIRSQRKTKKDNHNKTKTNYQKTIFKTKKRSLRTRHKHKTGTSRIKGFHK